MTNAAYRELIENLLGRRMTPAEWRWVQTEPAFDELINALEYDVAERDLWSRRCATAVESRLEVIRLAAVARRVESALTGDDRLTALAAALTMRAYAAASGHLSDGDEEVESLTARVDRFRRDQVVGFPLSLADVGRWVDDRACERSGSDVLLLVPKLNGYTRFAAVRPDSVLDELRQIARRLADEFGWTGEAEGVAFVLGDIAPVIQPISTKSGASWITMRVHKDVSHAEVADAYRSARAAVPRRAGDRTRPKSLGVHALRAAALSLLRSRSDWATIWAAWARQYPDHKFDSWRSFRRAAIQGRKAL